MSLLEFVSTGRPSDFVTDVEKTLAKKLLRAISEQASDVALQTYGTLEEYYGGDEQPDYVNKDDNAYAVFFATALKKFGVNGPEDFKDDATKQRFFDYVDHNWRSQDAVQAPIQGANGGGNMENGTQTQLPAPAALPQAPAAPTTQPSPTTAQGNDPSLATMAPAGPTTNQISPMGQQGSDPTLNGVQNRQTFAGEGPGDQYAASSDGDQNFNFGIPPMDAQQDTCPYCKGSGKAVCPTCGRAHGLDNQQPGMGQDQDPNLEIGPEGSEDGLEGGEQDPNGENIDDGDEEMEDGGMGDEEMDADEMGGDQQQQVPSAPGEDEDVDDPFDDEDAYSIDASDFGGAAVGNEDEDLGGDDDEGGMEGDEDEDEDLGDDEGGMDDQYSSDNHSGEDEDDDQDNDGIPDDAESDLNDDGIPDDDESEEDAEEDPDLEVGDAEDNEEEESRKKVPVGEALKHRSWSRKERKADSKKPIRAAGKKETKLAEDFGFGLDNAEDDVFLVEALMMQAKFAPVNPGLNKIIVYVQQQLSKIKKLRNAMLMQLRRQRSVIKKDLALGPEEKMDAMKQLATMAKDNRRFFKTQAKTVKAMFTGKLGGEDVDASDEQDGMDQDQSQPQKGGFPPKKGGFPPVRDEDGDEDMGEEPEVSDEVNDEEGDDEEPGGFPPKKKTPFPPKKKGGFPPAVESGDDGNNDEEDEEEPESDEGDEEEVAAPAPKFGNSNKGMARR